jgi:hypothetical protein
MNVDNVDNVWCEASRTFKAKRRESLQEKINELETNRKKKNITDLYSNIKEFKKGYQPRSNLIKDENSDLLADSRSTLNRWKNYFCQLLNVRGVNDVRQTEIHKAEPSVPEPSSFECETAIEKLKRYKSPGTDQIPAELIQVGDNALHSKTYKLIDCIWNKEELPDQWKESITAPICQNSKKNGHSNYSGISLLSTI